MLHALALAVVTESNDEFIRLAKHPPEVLEEAFEALDLVAVSLKSEFTKDRKFVDSLEHELDPDDIHDGLLLLLEVCSLHCILTKLSLQFFNIEELLFLDFLPKSLVFPSLCLLVVLNPGEPHSNPSILPPADAINKVVQTRIDANLS